MKYSDQQRDRSYQRLQELGKPVDYAGHSFDNFDLRPFLDQTLPGLVFSADQPRALEYGTGTGPGACYLAARGFQVDAIDISPTAIALARTFAAERNLRIHFAVDDICHFVGPLATYDLVVDNFCLHCLVADAQRRTAMNIVRSVLKPQGYYLIGTAIYRTDYDFRDDHFDPQTGIVYRKLGDDPQGYDDEVLLGDGWYFPRVRKVRPQQLRIELEQAGFRALRQDGGRVLCERA